MYVTTELRRKKNRAFFFSTNSDNQAHHMRHKMMFGQRTSVTLDWNEGTVTLQQTANDHILCWMTKHTVDEWNDSSCIMLTHFSVRNSTTQAEKHTVINDKVEFPTIYSDSFRSFGKTVSTEHRRAKMSRRSSDKRPRACEFTHFSVFSLHSFPLNFVLWHHHVCTLVWLRAPQGLAEGRECVYYNTLMPHTMFRLWSWLSPVGLLRLQPLLSLNLWGLINHTR